MNKQGIVYEDAATKYLVKKGYKILERNFKTKFGEIDIIALEKDVLVFIEVKGGKDDLYDPAERADINKLKKVMRTAEFFINRYKGNFEEVRIDVISVNKKLEITHYPSQRI
jgi:putative endonuclease